ncbi:MAG: YncE family protein [Terriglobales bacterium]|jgi:YVTN family beta-propeller protein
MERVRKVVLLGIVISSALILNSAEKTSPLRSADYIEVPGPQGKRFDYLTVDSEKQHLFATHLGAGLLHVIDLKWNKVIKTIPDLPGIEGVEIAADVNKVYTSDWFENKIGVIDLTSLKIIKKIPTEAKPDGIAYAPPSHKIYVSDERGKAEAVVDVAKDEIVTTLHFDSETGNVRYDPESRRVLVNLQEKNVVAEIDPATDKEVGRHPLGECRGNHGMALDVEHRLAFLVCEDNNLLAVFDLGSHKVTASLPLPDGGDVVAYDPGLHRIYVACYSGYISVFKEDAEQHIRKLADVPVEKKVHSLAIDLKTHKLYVPEQEEHGRPAARIAIYDAIADASEQGAH